MGKSYCLAVFGSYLTIKLSLDLTLCESYHEIVLRLEKLVFTELNWHAIKN